MNPSNNHRTRWNFYRTVLAACKKAVKSGKRIVPHPMSNSDTNCYCPLGVVFRTLNQRYPSLIVRSDHKKYFPNEDFNFKEFAKGFDFGDNSNYSSYEFKMGLKFRKMALEGGFK